MAIYSDIYGDEFAVLAPGWDPQWGYIDVRTFTGNESAPAGFTLVPVTGTFIMQDGSLARKGRILFTPSVHSATINGSSVIFSPFYIDLLNGSIPPYVVVHAPADGSSGLAWTWTASGRVGETAVFDTLVLPTTKASWALAPAVTDSVPDIIDNGDGTFDLNSSGVVIFGSDGTFSVGY